VRSNRKSKAWQKIDRDSFRAYIFNINKKSGTGMAKKNFSRKDVVALIDRLCAVSSGMDEFWDQFTDREKKDDLSTETPPWAPPEARERLCKLAGQYSKSQIRRLYILTDVLDVARQVNDLASRFSHVVRPNWSRRVIGNFLARNAGHYKIAHTRIKEGVQDLSSNLIALMDIDNPDMLKLMDVAALYDIQHRLSEIDTNLAYDASREEGTLTQEQSISEALNRASEAKISPAHLGVLSEKIDRQVIELSLAEVEMSERVLELTRYLHDTYLKYRNLNPHRANELIGKMLNSAKIICDEDSRDMKKYLRYIDSLPPQTSLPGPG